MWDNTAKKGRSNLPPDWLERREVVLDRDQYACQIGYPDICTHDATDVDHVGDNADHAISNLRSACSPCHNRRTALQGVEARKRKRESRFRKSERHPGSM